MVKEKIAPKSESKEKKLKEPREVTVEREEEKKAEIAAGRL